MVHLGPGDAHAHDALGPHRGAAGGDRLAQEAEAIFEAAAIAVLAQVEARVQELGRQIAMAGDDLDPVDPGRGHAARGGAIALDDLADHAGREGGRQDMEALIGHRRGRIGHGQAAVLGFHDLPPGMKELGEDPAAMGVDGLRHSAIAGDALVRDCHQEMGGIARRLMHAGDLQDDQARAAGGPGPVIGDQPVVDQPARGQVGIVAGGEDAVLQRDAAQRQGGEKLGKSGIHGNQLKMKDAMLGKLTMSRTISPRAAVQEAIAAPFQQINDQ